jgi:DNA-binding beta-propeller fold protein YncE
MVQRLLTGLRPLSIKTQFTICALILLIVIPAHGGKRQKAPVEKPWPELLLPDGRKLTYVQTLTSETDVRGRPGFWSKFFDVVAGEPDVRKMVRPFDIAVDSHGRIIVTDPGLAAVHIFDVQKNKYKRIDRWEKSKDPMIEPQCVAIDDRDNIYVTDSKAGKIFKFDSTGKSRTIFGSLKGGEGFFKRPTGIAIDNATHNVFVADTLRDRVYVLDAEGRVLRWFGKHGINEGEFNLPIELRLKDGLLTVVDAMNFRIQTFDMTGAFKSMIGTTGDPDGGVYRPKGIALDSEGHVYIVESEWGTIRVFDREGRLLYSFGNGTGFGNFALPTGLFIGTNDRVFVVDSYNRRVQVFQYHPPSHTSAGAQP